MKADHYLFAPGVIDDGAAESDYAEPATWLGQVLETFMGILLWAIFLIALCAIGGFVFGVVTRVPA